MIAPGSITSLRVRLAAWLLLPLSAFVLVCGYLSWQHAVAVADYVQDRDLLASAKVLSDRLIWEDDSVRASVPPSALSLFVSPEHDQVFLSVTDGSGMVLAGSPEFPPPQQLKLAGADRAQWYDTAFRGQSIRAVMTRRPMYDGGQERDINILVGKTTRSHDRMVNSLWFPTVAYLVIALLLAVVLTVIALTRELRPLAWLNEQIAAQDPSRLEEFNIDTRRLHTELRPVADTVNNFARKLRAYGQGQRRFIADAAHQLRTPLALQASQLEFARMARQHEHAADMDAALRALQNSNRQLVNVTNKLLMLAQAEHSRSAPARLEAVDLAQCALGCVEHLAAQAELRHIDLGMNLPPTNTVVRVQAQPALLDALISNLLDNALRYTPEGGRVTVSVSGTERGAELCVDDNGPGIPAESRERVFERFVRLANDAEGTGLGLAIVREIARALGATVTLETNPDETSGLRARVVFPA
ncbi:MAG: sensor histidine kinase [Rhodocyclaceae bacterium]